MEKDIKKVDLQTLMYMWDNWDKYLDDEEASPIAFHYEDIHAELNRRGEGRYCAV